LHASAARASSLGVLEAAAYRHGLSGPIDLGMLQRADLGDYLANDILAKVDRMSMAHGLEVRAPYLQPEMAAFALSACEPALWRRGRPKRLLREVACRVSARPSPTRSSRASASPCTRGCAAPAAPRARCAGTVGGGRSRALTPPLSIAAGAPVGRRSLGWSQTMVLVAWHRAHPNAPEAPVKLADRARPPLATAAAGHEDADSACRTHD
jgi:asparagine synthase (glutamine-hydrolysing)